MKTKKRKTKKKKVNQLRYFSTSSNLISAGATSTGSLSIFGHTAVGSTGVINTWDENVEECGGGVWMKREQYFPEEIELKFATSSSHKRKFKINEIFKHGVYILYRKNVVVYIGESKNPYQRICNHQKSDKEFDCFRILYCKESRKKYWEKKLINAYFPVYNKTGKNLPKKPVFYIRPTLRRI